MGDLLSEGQESRITDDLYREADILLKPSEVAKWLNIHINTVRRWSRLGVLPSLRIGPRNDRRFRSRDIKMFIKKHPYDYSAHQEV